jgi:soluble lytic murein transglycosylase-like protein
LQYRADLIRAARVEWGMGAPVATFAAQIHQESHWRPDARSPVGASGLAQFMPATATWLCGRSPDLPPGCNTMNAAWALRALIAYDRYLFELTPTAGDDCGRMWAALRGYNGGFGHWRTEWRNAGSPAELRDADAACGTGRRSARHCPENLGYPRRIIERWQPAYVAAGWGAGVCH